MKHGSYNEERWKHLRGQIMRRDGYMDQELKRYGKRKPAELVHHIFPSDEFPEYFYEPWNLTAISKETHEKLHDRDTNELTEAGAELLRRTARKNGIPVPLRYLPEQIKQKKKGRGNNRVGIFEYYRGIKKS